MDFCMLLHILMFSSYAEINCLMKSLFEFMLATKFSRVLILVEIERFYEVWQYEVFTGAKNYGDYDALFFLF